MDSNFDNEQKEEKTGDDGYINFEVAMKVDAEC